ncbi:unnamed protein product [Meloidogyne enterolobii]|uniref:Uncharacterized protein n=1 Tax=Meloidogyne enterolobii TaxID=390850 RepID=A0ACB0Y9T9_MELEN
MFLNIFLLIILLPSIIYCVYIQSEITDSNFKGEGPLKELHNRVSAFISEKFNVNIKKFPNLSLNIEEKGKNKINNKESKIKEIKRKTKEDEDEGLKNRKRKTNLINSLLMPEKAIMNKKEWEQMLKEDPILADCLFKMDIEKQINNIYYQIRWLLESRRFISTASSDDYIKLKDVTKDLNELQLDNKHLIYLKKVYKRLEKNFKKLQKSVEKEEEELKENERINNDYVSSGSDQEIKELNESNF